MEKIQQNTLQLPGVSNMPVLEFKYVSNIRACAQIQDSSKQNKFQAQQS
jgi:hypothetical protein